MPLEVSLEPALNFRACFFLVPELGSDLLLADPFTTFADDEAIIGTYAFYRVLNDRSRVIFL